MEQNLAGIGQYIRHQVTQGVTGWTRSPQPRKQTRGHCASPQAVGWSWCALSSELRELNQAQRVELTRKETSTPAVCELPKTAKALRSSRAIW